MADTPPTVTVSGLPDGRQYEMVSPPEKNGALLGDFIFGPIPTIAEDGSRVIDGTLQCFAGAEACVGARAKTGSFASFSRGPAGWSPTTLTLPATQFAKPAHLLASAETGAGLFSAAKPPEGEDHFYVRTSAGAIADVGPVSPPAGGPSLGVLDNLAATASADLSRIVYEADPIWPGSGLGNAVFEYVGSGNAEPALVGVSGAEGSRDLVSECRTRLGGEGGPGASHGALSDDGHIVYFTAISCGSGTGANAGTPVPVNEIFARVEEPGSPRTVRTVAISEPRASQVSAAAEAQLDCTSIACQEATCDSPSCLENWRQAFFVQASSDGLQTVFMSPQQLTDTASQDTAPEDTEAPCNETTGPGGCNAYLFDLAQPSGHRLLDVSAGEGPVPGGPRVQGVIALSSDGSHVYFVAKGVLTTSANQQGESAQDGAENLYVFVRDAAHPAGHVTFIATPPEADPGTVSAITNPGSRQANVTPDGRFLVFTSGGALTKDVTRTDGAQQVYRYDAETAQLTRISVGQNGYDDNGNAGAGDAVVAPAWKGFARPGAGRPDPTMSSDGAYVFFMSPVALVPGALESVPIASGGTETAQYAENVYEYHEGNVSLISDGHDTASSPAFACEGISSFGLSSAVCLVGVDETGSNVFFTTTDQLVSQDTDTGLDLYDARICTGAIPCVAAPVPTQPPCVTSEACQGALPATPSLLIPGSTSLSGAGNLPPSPPSIKKPITNAQKLTKALKACHKEKGKSKRKRCEAAAHKRYDAKKAKKAAKKASRDRMNK